MNYCVSIYIMFIRINQLLNLLKLYRFDWLEVHDGGYEDAPIINGKLCGKDVPEPITSTGHELLLRFRSDGNAHYSGFKIKIMRVVGPDHEEL